MTSSTTGTPEYILISKLEDPSGWVQKNVDEHWYQIQFQVRRKVQDINGNSIWNDREDFQFGVRPKDEQTKFYGTGYTNSPLVHEYFKEMARGIQNREGYEKYKTNVDPEEFVNPRVEIINPKGELVWRSVNRATKKDDNGVEETDEEKIARVECEMTGAGKFMILKNNHGYSRDCKCLSRCI
jgi:hypothetical protein